MTTQPDTIIEGEAREVDEPRALAVVPDRGMAATGPLALAGLTDDEFERRLSALDTMRTRVARMQKALMVEGVDYGLIPGTPKPSLLKPGAEKLCQAYGLAADFIPTRIVGDGVADPHLSYGMRCELHLGSTDGLVVAVGNGSANSWERKYRYRRGERTCPSCGKVGTIIKGKEQYGGGWVCWKKKDGCDAKWPDGSAAIEDQVVGDVENPDPWDLDTTLLKMAEKRAFVDATLRATAASGLFTQDVEDKPRQPDEPPQEPQNGPQRPLGAHDTPPPRPELERRANGLIGKVATSGTQDYQLRETPDGWVLPFRLKDGPKVGQIVIAHDALAQALAPMRELIGQRVTVWGTYTDETIKKPDGDISFKVLHLTRIQTPDFTLPADVPADGAPSAPAVSEAEELDALVW